MNNTPEDFEVSEDVQTIRIKCSNCKYGHKPFVKYMIVDSLFSLLEKTCPECKLKKLVWQ